MSLVKRTVRMTPLTHPSTEGGHTCAVPSCGHGGYGCWEHRVDLGNRAVEGSEAAQVLLEPESEPAVSGTWAFSIHRACCWGGSRSLGMWTQVGAISKSLFSVMFSIQHKVCECLGVVEIGRRYSVGLASPSLLSFQPQGYSCIT